MPTLENLIVNPATRRIENKRSREFQDEKIDLLYQTWDAKDLYKKVKRAPKKAYETRKNEIDTELIRIKAEIANWALSKKEEVKKAKKTAKKNKKEIIEQAKLHKSEWKIKTKNAQEFRDLTYKKEMFRYSEEQKKLQSLVAEQKATTADVENLIKQQAAFATEYASYNKNKIIEEEEAMRQGIENVSVEKKNLLAENEKTLLANLQAIQNQYSKANYRDFLKKHQIEKAKFVEHAKQNRLQYRQQKKENQPAVKAEKARCKQTLLALREKKEALKKRKKAYALSLSGKDAAIYKRTESLVQSDMRSVHHLRIDEKERRFFTKFNPAYIYILPAIFGALFFTLMPFFFMIIGCFFTIDLTNLGDSVFVGVQNFIDIFLYDKEFQKALYQTLIFAGITIVLLTFITTAMAAWLAKNTKIHNLTQTMVFTPHIASLLSVSILWIALLEPTGVINTILKLFGIQGPSWLIDEKTSLVSVAFVTVWKSIGYYVLIIIAGLQNIPAYVYEAAKLDKAKRSTTFFKVTLPLLSPTLVFTFIIRFINCFKIFASIEVMTNGGPLGSSMVLSYWIYKVGRLGYNYGFAMAGAVVLTLIIGTATFLQYRFFNKKVTYQ